MRKMEVARLIAPKIAYQWFSNVLSSWTHFWLHDGLATLFGEEAIVKVSIFINNGMSMNYFKFFISSFSFFKTSMAIVFQTFIQSILQIIRLKGLRGS